MTNDKASWADRQTLSSLWISILHKATYSMIENDYRSYKRAIDILANSLFKEERDLVFQYKSQLQNDSIEAYMLIQQYIIDLLEAKGYIKYQAQTIPESTEGIPERSWEQ